MQKAAAAYHATADQAMMPIYCEYYYDDYYYHSY